jgi:hypothetical protein
MSDENEYEREGEGDDRLEALRADVEARIGEAIEQASVELAEAPPPSAWEVFALGPFQDPVFAAPPGRIIELGETAFLVTIVFLNEFMDTNVSAFGGSVQLNYYTSNTQTMEPVPAMDFSCCFDPNCNTGFVVPGLGTFYVSVREFEPTEAGCILETNICARICNCDEEVVPGYAAFVRWIANLDFDLFFPPVFLTFDHPIRYLVYDNDDDTNCNCADDCPPLVQGPCP